MKNIVVVCLLAFSSAVLADVESGPKEGEKVVLQ